MNRVISIPPFQFRSPNGRVDQSRFPDNRPIICWRILIFKFPLLYQRIELELIFFSILPKKKRLVNQESI
ncbi:hypothetical protein DO021_15520 [Desulfobacter hydrogenophilus]|uniref:Uncharacterized protein n=1 Tax=Desulfobacter hydrogenophilus TaxID=2291 RepID=A0A328FDF9_9BACT|nr:hypothetical protein DO021_15520 [Desulfobacter hydrogenophilus]